MQELLGFTGAWRVEKCDCRAGLADSSTMHKDDVIGEPPRLPNIVGDEDGFRSGIANAFDGGFDNGRGRGVQIGGRLIEKQDLGVCGERACERQTLLFSPG